MGPEPTDTRQTAVGTVSGRSWAVSDGRPLCPRGSTGKRRHCLHHRNHEDVWYCCQCPHTRTDGQASDPNWSEDG